jgi:DNA-directed RNA polymerase subunit N (RpoN/RPB10)
MEKYNYLESVKQDVREYINEHDIVVNEDNRDEVEQQLNDDCFICDSVTGNASGSYTFNTWQAEENLCHNLDLLGEALTEFCCEPNYITEKGAEACDVTIRCYLLGQAISEVLDEMLEEDEDDD